MEKLFNSPPCEIIDRNAFGEPVAGKPLPPNGVFYERDGTKHECWVQREFVMLVDLAPFEAEDRDFQFRFFAEVVVNAPNHAKFKIPNFVLRQCYPIWLPPRLLCNRRNGAKKAIYERMDGFSALTHDFNVVGGMPTQPQQVGEIFWVGSKRAKPLDPETLFPTTHPAQRKAKPEEKTTGAFNPGVLSELIG